MLDGVKAFNAQQTDVAQPGLGGGAANSMHATEESLQSKVISFGMFFCHAKEQGAFAATDIHFQGHSALEDRADIETLEVTLRHKLDPPRRFRKPVELLHRLHAWRLIPC